MATLNVDGPSREQEDALGIPDGRTTNALVAMACVAAITVLGSWVFFFDGLGLWVTLTPMAGIISAIACRRYADAAASSALGVVLGGILATVALRVNLAGLASWSIRLTLPALTAAAVALVLTWLLRQSPRLGGLFMALAVAIIVLAGWSSAVSSASILQDVSWATGTAAPQMTFTQALQITPVQTAASGDQAMYLVVIHEVAAGKAFYPTLVAAIAESSQVHGDADKGRLDSPLNYRPPTVFFLLSRLPNNGISWVLAALALQAAGTVAAYLLARRFVSAPVALVGATTVAVYGATLAATPGILVTETWAGVLALMSVAVFVQSARSRRARFWLNVAAMLLASIATLTNDLAVAFLLVGLAATLADKESREAHDWLWWAAGLAFVFAAYLIHWRLAVDAFYASHLPSGTAGSPYPWFHPDGLGLVAAIELAARAMRLQDATIWIVWLTGAVGSLVVPAGRRDRVALAMVGVGGTIALTTLRPRPPRGASKFSWATGGWS